MLPKKLQQLLIKELSFTPRFSEVLDEGVLRLIVSTVFREKPLETARRLFVAPITSLKRGVNEIEDVWALNRNKHSYTN